MIKSMTGFASLTRDDELGTLGVTIRSVNHRFLDLQVRVPPVIADLEARLRDLVAWMHADHSGSIDPVVAAAMGHYEFEALHPFHDGNGRLGRLLIVLQLYSAGVLTEPTLSVSPWFEARRQEYYNALLRVSTDGDWSTWIEFFALGLAESAEAARTRMLALAAVQTD